jgi:hypothetical protein
LALGEERVPGRRSQRDGVSGHDGGGEDESEAGELHLEWKLDAKVVRAVEAEWSHLG